MKSRDQKSQKDYAHRAKRLEIRLIWTEKKNETKQNKIGKTHPRNLKIIFKMQWGKKDWKGVKIYWQKLRSALSKTLQYDTGKKLTTDFRMCIQSHDFFLILATNCADQNYFNTNAWNHLLSPMEHEKSNGFSVVWCGTAVWTVKLWASSCCCRDTERNRDAFSL